MEQQETASIRFYTAGCMEFENYSECYENLTLAQAVDIYKKYGNGMPAASPALGLNCRIRQSRIIQGYTGRF